MNRIDKTRIIPIFFFFMSYFLFGQNPGMKNLDEFKIKSKVTFNNSNYPFSVSAQEILPEYEIKDAGDLICPSPINLATDILSQTNARANWEQGGTESAWNLEWGPTGFTQGSGTSVTGLTATLFDFGNLLTEGTAYDWYVQADCGGETSPWVGPVTFATFNANDFCVNATPVGEVTDLPFSTLSATSDGYAPGCGGSVPPVDIWYLYTPSMDGLATFDLCGSNFDTRLAIWEACPDGVISSLACNDDGCGLQSKIIYEVTTTSSYYVQVCGFGTSKGLGDLSIQVLPVISNDQCMDATLVPTTFPYTTTGTNIGATGDCPALLGPEFNAVWYEIPIENAFNCIQIDFCGTMNMYNGGIVLMNDCLCDDYIVADFTDYTDCPDPALYMEFYNIPGGPGQTLLFPAYVEDVDGDPLSFTLNINVAPSSTTAVTSGPLSKTLITGQNGFDLIEIQNLGTVCNTEFTAHVINAPGIIGLYEDFESGSFPPAGWSVVNNGGDCDWYDQDASEPSPEGNLTEGSGNFADADSDNCGDGTVMDTELWTPVLDLSGYVDATLSFNHFFFDASWINDTAIVDVSIDGGANWSNLLSFGGSSSSGYQIVTLPVGSANTIIRFHYIAPDWDWYWQVDDVTVEGFAVPTGWLTLDGVQTTSGDVLAGESGSIQVAFNAEDINPGTYNSQIEVITTDPTSGKSATLIDVTMFVESGLSLEAKVFLEGPYDAAGKMSTGLNAGGYIPLNQPYNPTLPYYGNASPEWLYAGAESVATVPDGVVDWVIVQLRDADDAASANSATIEAEQASFLLEDGSVVGLDGISRLGFQGTTIDNDLFVVIYHRNHLGVISANPASATGGYYSYDFSSGESQVLGGTNGHKELEPGVWGMIAADGNGNGLIQNTDETAVWKLDLGTSGYKGGDFNMNGLIQNTDETDIWKPNLGGGGQIPAKSSGTGYQSQVPQ